MPRRCCQLLVTAALIAGCAHRGPIAKGAITAQADDLRTSWYPDQPALDPAIVGSPRFGRLWKTRLPLAPDEQVFVQPLVSGGTVLVATAANNIYALDAVTGAIKAARSLGPPWLVSDLGCSDLKPTVGVTGTPVIDAATRTAYLLSKTYRARAEGPPRARTVWYAHAVDVDTLAERAGFPVEIAGAAANDPSVRFDAFVQHQRVGLLLMNGVVYAAFGGHCDMGEYNGWIAGVGTDGRIRTLFATEAGPRRVRGAGIWQSGAALASDGPGRIFAVTGNGYSRALVSPTPGTAPPATLDQSVVRLDVRGDGALAAADFFAPYDVETLDRHDLDFGGGGPVALPSPTFGNGAARRLLAVGGKAGVLYLLDRDRLGGFRQGSGGGDAVVSAVSLEGGLWSRPAVWPGDGGYVYVVPSMAPLAALRYGVGGDGKPALALAGRSADVFGYSSGAPIVTSDGTSSGSALVWVKLTTGSYGQGQLRAYDAVPDAVGNLALRFEDAYGVHASFSAPGVGAGRIYVGTGDGHVLGYGSPRRAPVAARRVDFGTAIVGAAKNATVILRAEQDIRVTGLSLSHAAFRLEGAGPALPARLDRGQTLAIPVTFTAAAPAPYVASLEIETSAGSAAVSLNAKGQAAGSHLSIQPQAVTFGGVAIGAAKQLNITLANAGSQPLVWDGFTRPKPPFSVGALPSVGRALAPGATLTLPVRFSPTEKGTFAGSLSVRAGGSTIAVYMSGSAGEPGRLALSTSTVDFGAVPFGQSKTATFSITNAGGADLTITKSKRPTLRAFGALTRLDEGTVIAPGKTLTLTVVFIANFSGGGKKDQWIIAANDGSGPQEITLTGKPLKVGAPTTAPAPKPSR